MLKLMLIIIARGSGIEFVEWNSGLILVNWKVTGKEHGQPFTIIPPVTDGSNQATGTQSCAKCCLVQIPDMAWPAFVPFTSPHDCLEVRLMCLQVLDLYFCKGQEMERPLMNLEVLKSH